MNMNELVAEPALPRELTVEKREAKVLRWDEEKTALVAKKIESAVRDININSENVNDATVSFQETVFRAAYDVIGKVKRFPPVFYQTAPEWMSSTHYKHLKNRCKSLRKNRANPVTRNKFLESKRELNKYIQQMSLRDQLQQAIDLNSWIKSNSRRFYQLMNGDPDVYVPNISLDAFTSFFKEVTNPPDMLIYLVPTDMSNRLSAIKDVPEFHPDLDIPITLPEMKKCLLLLKNRKAPGIDGICIEVFKNSPATWPIITDLFNRILHSGTFPDTWRTGLIAPLHKKGCKDNVRNYRGIALLPVLSKLFTKILNTRLLTWLERIGGICDNQCGFRRNRSTMDNVFIISGMVRNALKNNKKVYSCFVDFSKAFDWTQRAYVWDILRRKGCKGKLLCILMDMYNVVKTRVRATNGDLGDEFLSELGFKQGESASPSLFVQLIDDLKDYLDENGADGVTWLLIIVKILLFADDITLLDTTIVGLTRHCRALQSYCMEYGLTVNVDKTYVMVFRKGYKCVQPQIFYDGRILPVCNKFTYLGTTLHYNGLLNIAIHDIALKTRKVIHCVERKQHEKLLSPKALIYYFNGKVLSVMLHGAELWAPCPSDDVDILYTSYLKRILGLRADTSHAMLLLDTGCLPISYHRAVRAVGYWARLVSGVTERERMVFQVYMNMRDDEEETWTMYIKARLREVNLLEYWETNVVAEKGPFMLKFKRLYKDKCRKDMCDSIGINKGNFFRELHDTQQDTDFYLYSADPKVNKTLARWRMRNTYLKIETGCWAQHKLNLADRICNVCMMEENEHHVITTCPRFKNIRRKHLSKCGITWETLSVQDLAERFNTKDFRFLRQLALFCNEAETILKEQYRHEVLPTIQVGAYRNNNNGEQRAGRKGRANRKKTPQLYHSTTAHIT